MLDTRLENELRSILLRYRLRAIAWWLALTWLFAGLLLILVGSALASLATPRTWVRWLLAFGMLSIVAAWVASRLRYRNIHWIAGRIESRFPELRQRLWTAMGIDVAQPVGYLPQSVLNETISHAGHHDWRQVLPSVWILIPWLTQFATFSLFVWSGATLVGLIPPSSIMRDGVGWNLMGSESLVVEPGDSEVERGTNVIVTAKYGNQIPVHSWLYTTNEAGEVNRIEMRRNLKDPVFAGYLLQVQSPLEYAVHGTRGEQITDRSRTFQLKVFDYPALVRSDAVIVPPSFARQASKTIDDTRRVTVIEGSELTWRLRMNKPLDKAILLDQQGESHPLQPLPEDPLVYTARFMMEDSDRWKLQLLDREGRSSKVEEVLIAKVLENAPPEVKLQRATDISVSPLEELQLQGKSSDDFGIVRAGVTFSVGAVEPTEIVLAEGESLGKQQPLLHLLELEKLEAKPDQLVSYYFWAEDVDRHGDVRRVDGEMFFAEVRPFEEIFRQGQSQDAQQQANQQPPSGSQAAQQSEQLAELQKKIIAGTWNVLRRESGKTRTADFNADVDLLSDSQEEALQKTDELEQSLTNPQSQSILEGVRDSMTIAIDHLKEASSRDDVLSLRDAVKAEQAAYEGLLRLRAREHQVARQQQRNQNQQGSSGSQQNRQEQLQQLQLEEDRDRFESERQATPEPQADRDMRQVMNRLDELAKRQKDLNQQLKDLETALQAADTEQEKQELAEELKRLRENQEELLRDSDELLERMNQAQPSSNENTQQAMEQAKQAMEEARQNLQKSNEALQQNQTSPALSAGTRAQRQMDETRENLRKQTANQFEQTMRDMLNDAQQLEKRQQELTQRLDPQRNSDGQNISEEQPSGLRPDGDAISNRASDRQAWESQKEELQRLSEAMQETVKEAEASEPLLADKLYDAFREARQRGIEKKMDEVPILAERGLLDPARKVAEEANQGIRSLREDIEQAAESVLGSEAESLRRALGELERLNDQLNEELKTRGGIEPQQQPGQQQPGQQQPGQQQPGQQQPGQQQPGQQQPGQQQPGQQQPGQQQPGQQQPGQQQPGQQQPGQQQPGQQQTGQQPNDARRGSLERLERDSRSAAPLTGEDYARWSDALRDVEEMVRDPELRAEAARIREAARDIRRDYKRFSKAPQWPLVQKLIAQPLRELQHQIEQEYIRQTAERNAVVPIDRDPVPGEFERALQKYYENLGGASGR